MANLITLQEQIFKFLKRKDPQVMAIKGSWGVGKTHAWKNFLKEKKNEINTDFKNYSYVSLFGIDSIEKLKFTIFEKSVANDLIGEEISVETFFESKKDLLKLLSKKGTFLIPFITKFLSYIKFGAIAGQAISYLPTISYLSVKNTIICLDDLERTELDMREILGIVSELKEEKNCKIVLIFNEEKLSDDENFARKKYEEYREKVIDIEIKFEPESKECVFICFRGQDDFPVDDYAILKDTCYILKITNIRIMNKIIQLWKELPDLDKELFDMVKDRVALTLIFISHLFYAPNTLEEKKEGMLGKQLDAFLDGISGFTLLFPNQLKGTTNLDREILFAVENGYFKESDLNNSIKKYIDDFTKHKQDIENNNKLQKIDNDYEKAWDKLHSSFNDNEILDDMYEATLRYVTEFPENFGIDKLNGVVKFLHEFSGDTYDTSKIIDLYVDKQDDGGYKKMMRFSSLIRVNDELKEKIITKHKSKAESVSLDDILLRLTDNPSCSPEYKLIIDNSNEDDYYEAFKRIDNKNMYTAIQNCLTLVNEAGKENINKALDKLATESKMNALRVDNIRRLH